MSSSDTQRLRPSYAQSTHRNRHPIAGRGHSLHAATRQHFESQLGADFSSVRIHSDREAHQQARQHSALAFTLGEQVVFGRNAPPPGCAAGRALLAHELTHVLQHRLGGGQDAVSVARAESEASTFTERVGQASAPTVQAGIAPHVPLRTPEVGGTEAPQLQLGLTRPTSPLSGFGSHTNTTRYELTGFETNSHELTDDHRQMIQAIADDLNARPLLFGGFASIWGFADRRGTEEHNERLGQRRADAVRDALARLVTDPDTRRQIRAYSFGEPEEGPETDDPSLRMVEVSVTRRQLDMQLIAHDVSVPTPTLGGAQPPILRPTIPVPAPGVLPPWLMRNLPSVGGPSVDLNTLSRVITDGIRQPLAGAVAPLARSIANAFGAGVSEREVRQWLDQQMVSGGEAGLRAALRQIVEAIAGSPTTPPPLPYGPNVREVDVPGTRIFRSPVLRF